MAPAPAQFSSYQDLDVKHAAPVAPKSYPIDWWGTRWQTENTQWHLPGAHHFLEAQKEMVKTCFERTPGSSEELPKSFEGRILVPLCGATVDLLYLAFLTPGCEVVGVEWSEVAARTFFAGGGEWEGGCNPEDAKSLSEEGTSDSASISTSTSCPWVRVENAATGVVYYQANQGHDSETKEGLTPFHNIKIYIGDFIHDEKLFAAVLNDRPFNLIWDRASLVAINIEDRGKYCERIKGYGSGKGETTYLVMVYEYPGGCFREGPPREITWKEMERLFGPKCCGSDSEPKTEGGESCDKKPTEVVRKVDEDMTRRVGQAVWEVGWMVGL